MLTRARLTEGAGIGYTQPALLSLYGVMAQATLSVFSAQICVEIAACKPSLPHRWANSILRQCQSLKKRSSCLI